MWSVKLELIIHPEIWLKKKKKETKELTSF